MEGNIQSVAVRSVCRHVWRKERTRLQEASNYTEVVRARENPRGSHRSESVHGEQEEVAIENMQAGENVSCAERYERGCKRAADEGKQYCGAERVDEEPNLQVGSRDGRNATLAFENEADTRDEEH